MGNADLHIHTTYSHDGTATLSAVMEQAYRVGLDVIAITDHDRMDGALRAQEIAPQYHLEIVPGIEVSTADGHLLALYVDTLIPARMSLIETALCVQEAGGLCVVAHPFAFGAHSLNLKKVEAALTVPKVTEVLIGIETCNASLIYRATNRAAARMAEKLNLSAIGSSDSHIASTIGHGRTLFAGQTAADLRQALTHNQTLPLHFVPRRTAGFYIRHISQTLLRRMGWVTWVSQPNSETILRRLVEVQQTGH